MSIFFSRRLSSWTGRRLGRKSFHEKKIQIKVTTKIIKEGNDLQNFWRDYTILDSINDIHTAWEVVKQSTFLKSWRKIFPNVQNTFTDFIEAEQIFARGLASLIKFVTGGEKMNEGNIEQWINCDANDRGFDNLRHKQIVS